MFYKKPDKNTDSDVMKLRAALDMAKTIIEKSVAIDNLTAVLRNLGQYAEAEDLYREALEIKQKVYEEGHPEIANSINNLGLVLRELGRYEEAEK